MSHPRRHSRESGFALLMVFVLAAVIAITLYYELPRVMFERTREREQLLIDRGEQYSLAVRRFYVKFGRWPVSMDELENTNNIRFLRRQYKDPMTGKADWRIIHETAGVLTDSLVHPASALTGPTGGTGSQQTFGTLTSSQPFGSAMSSSDSSDNPDQPAPKAWGLLFRPSDRGPLGSAHGGVSAGDDDTQASSNASNSSGAASPLPDASAPASTPATPATPTAGLTGASGATGNSVAQGIMASLMGPRQSSTTAAGGQNQSITGGGIGIAGVASTSQFQGIKRYKDKSKYKEWEFVFDMNAMQSLQNPQQGQPQQNLPGQSSQTQQTNGPLTSGSNPTPPTTTGP